MVLYRKWIDFVLYPYEPDKVQTLGQRLDITHAVDKDNALVTFELIQLIKKNGMVIKQNSLEDEADNFEAMEIDDKGNVKIWTKKRVGIVLRHEIESIDYIPRHPPKK
ncbi:MAG: hypothetical protein WAQ98_00515 [Blastocatellia bacterium]